MSSDRRQREIDLLRERYGEIEQGQDRDWLLFKHFRLPEGWNREETELLVLIPPGYPTTPPDNFYVRSGLRLEDETMPASYTDVQTVLGESWGQFSFHSKEWNPSMDLDDGDSLLTFLLAAEHRLKELN